MGVGVAVVAVGWATGRWAQRRCDEALAGAHLIPAPSQRSFALIAGLEAGLAYVNIHNAEFPGGEIRARIPEPMTLALAALGLGIAGLARRRQLPR